MILRPPRQTYDALAGAVYELLVRPAPEQTKSATFHGGRVEVDEAYVGGVHPGRSGRQTETKALVAVAVQVERRRLGRIRLRRIPDASGPTLLGFVQDAIEPGSLVHTDGWVSYDPLRRHGYKHRITFLEGQSKSPSQLNAARPPSGLAAQAVAARHAPWRGNAGTSGLLS
jgi:transposase-like protein